MTALTRITTLRGLLLAALALALLPLHAACPKPKPDAKPLEIKLVTSEATSFSAAADEAQLKLPLQLPPTLKAAEVSVSHVQVRRDKLLDVALEKSFEVTPKLVNDKDTLPAVRVKISQIAALLPGSYSLLLAFTEPCGASIAPLAVTLERPAAQLQAVGKVSIDVLMPHLFAGAHVAAPSVIHVLPTDTAAVSALRKASFIEGAFSAANGRQVAATLAPSAADAQAGQTLEVKLAPKGFPVGTSLGEFELRSPDLKAPLTIKVEVRGRIWALWILVFVALGIVMGFVLRVFLQGRIELNQARVSGSAAIQEQQARMAPISDPAFQAATSPALVAMAQALQTGKVADITRCQAALVKAVDEALPVMRRAVADAQAMLLALRELDSGAGNPPPPMQAAIDALAKPCDEAAQALQAQNATRAKKILDAAWRLARSALQAAWPMWRQTVDGLDADATSLRSLLDPRQDAARELGAADLPFPGPRLDALKDELAVPDFDDPAAVGKAVLAWRNFDGERRAALQKWAGFLRDDMVTLQALVRERVERPNALAAVLDAAQAEVEKVAVKLQAAAAAEDWRADLQPEARQALAAASAVVVAVLAQRKDLDAELLKSLHEELRQQHVVAALLLVEPERNPTLGATKMAPAASGTPGAGSTPTPDLVIAPRAAKHDAAPPAADADLAAVRALALRSKRELAQEKAWQTTLVALIVLGVSYAFFEERFFGTPVELLGLFFWGFSADLSLAGLLQLAGGLAAKPKGAS